MAAWTEQAMLQEAAVTSSNVCVRVCVWRGSEWRKKTFDWCLCWGKDVG